MEGDVVQVAKVAAFDEFSQRKNDGQQRRAGGRHR
jgi:hypothetical protein